MDIIKQYSLIYADPPWKYDFSKSKSRKIENHYQTMSLDDICGLPIDKISAPDCVLFMWAVAPKIPEACQVTSAWGFTYKTQAIWHKPGNGMGHYFRINHEIIIVATRGKPGVPKPADRVSSVFLPTVKMAPHSQKPIEFYQVLEKMYPAKSKVELFQRVPRRGWDGWGNEQYDFKLEELAPPL